MRAAVKLGVFLLFGLGSVADAQTGMCSDAPAYGDNAVASARTKVNGISLYYETYGQGDPLLLIHGNGGSIDRLRCQIAFFSKTRRVIIADSRAHGHSEDGPKALALKYEPIADDLSELIKSLGIKQIDVLGHSDGGIVALLLAIRHPSQVGKVIASSPNLQPDAIIPGNLANLRNRLQKANEKIAAGDDSQDTARLQVHLERVLTEPHITPEDLHRITAPTLIMAGDDDEIPLDHIIEIAKGIPHAQLAILPAATHDLLRGQDELYNYLASRFFEVTFARR